MFEEYQNLAVFPTSSADVLANLLVALVCGLLLSMIYRLTYRGPSYSITFVNSLVLLSIISAIVIMVIGNNIARAFGLVGAMSIIRFRTAIRDTMDLVFIFLALALGMACGVGLNAVAVTGTLMAGLVVVVLTFTHFGAPRRRHFLVQIIYHAAEQRDVSQPLARFCRSLKLVSLKNVGLDDLTESNYHITLRDARKTEEMVQEIRRAPGVQQVNVFFDEDDYNPPTM
ncbi:MAG: DUF4956 domain-containing protein [Saprospiraceae bacterium]|nr:DUF4956 domain-containing protein [Saprospiraceae bacterium]MCB9305412.1 DUF4956 domain-containing protein [Lewinellaceae bacterium]MCB9355947.1 DUF4956 domain-containing protein [Lewinellaceae bacterium]